MLFECKGGMGKKMLLSILATFQKLASSSARICAAHVLLCTLRCSIACLLAPFEIWPRLQLSHQFAYADDCEEMDSVCTAPGGTREFEGTNVYKPCWAYTYGLNCDKKSKNDCDKISVDDCLFSSEECAEKMKIGDSEVCINKRYTYACEKESTYETEAMALDENPTADVKDLMCKTMCLDGNCSAIKKAAIEVNSELQDAAAVLNGVLNAKKDLEGDKLISVFKGSAEHCDRVITDALKCCDLKGWIEGKLGFGCNAAEKNLAQKRKDKKCVHVGRYCREKLAGGCIKKRNVYCCYDSIVGRIINQEAKKQLGLNNGTAKNPNCGGITLEDLSKVDLSKANFQDFYDGILAPNIRLPDFQVNSEINTQAATNIMNAPDKNGFNENFKHD